MTLSSRRKRQTTRPRTSAAASRAARRAAPAGVAVMAILFLALYAANSAVAEDSADSTSRRFVRPAQVADAETQQSSASRPSARKAQHTKLRWKRPRRVRPAVHVDTDGEATSAEIIKLSGSDHVQTHMQLGDPSTGEPTFDEDEPAFPADESEPELPMEELPGLEQPDRLPMEEDDDLLDEPLVLAPRGQEAPCPSPRDLKRISEITNDIAPSGDRFPTECPLGDEVFVPRNWAITTYTWKASGLCHKPLYFEQVTLERYGHSFAPLLEPVVSGAHFFATVPILPYKMGLEHPCECVYPLGYYRPGSCAPRMIYPIPISLRAALYQGVATTGLIFAVP